jgi:hypothetical protein
MLTQLRKGKIIEKKNLKPKIEQERIDQITFTRNPLKRLRKKKHQMVW